MGNLTTHVLDTAAGCPGAGIVIELFRLENERILLTTVRTNNDGRCDQPLLADEDFRAGEYELSPHSSAIEIFEHIASGRVKTHPIVVPEGLRASEIAQRLEDAGLIDADEFLAVAFDPTVPEELGVQGHSLEGYLYPETYLLPRGLAAREIARQFVDEFLDVWSEIEPQARAQHLSMADTVTDLERAP